MKKARVLLADEHPPLLHHLTALLSEDFCIVGTVCNGKALLPDIKVIVLTNQIEEDCVAAAFSAGASAFLSKVGRRNLRGRLRAVIRDLHPAPLERYAGHARFRQDAWMPIEKGLA